MSNETPIQEDVARHVDRQRYVRRAWQFGVLLVVALVCISCLATLLWVQSDANVIRLSRSNDSQISQFEYCQKALKTDPKCKEPVSEPAAKVIEGPRGLQGVEGPIGPVGPEGPQGPPGARGPQGLPGNSPRCLLEPSRCVGPAGASGQPGIAGKDGEDGADGVDGTDGADGVDGQDGTDGADGKDGIDGKPPASWSWTDSQGWTYTCSDPDGDLKYTCPGTPPANPPGEGVLQR